MQKKDGKIYFSLNVIAAFLIFVIVYCNYNLLIGYKPGINEGSPANLRYIVMNISAFLCSLLLQGGEILMISRQRKSLLIRWELIILGVVIFLLGLIKFWYILLFSNNLNTDHSFIVTATIAVFLVGNIDIIFMFVAGILFVHAFHIQEGVIENKNRKNYFVLYALLILLIVVIDYCNVWFFVSKYNESNYFVYILYFLNIFKIFAYSLVLQGEKILTTICNKKALFVRWELIILGIISLLFAIIKIWLALFLFNSTSAIIQSINTSDLWQIAYIFAAGMFFVRAFNIKTDLIDNERNEHKGNNSFKTPE